MSLLLNLPNVLCNDIIHDWIISNIYYCWLILDTAIKISNELRNMLLNHFNFAQGCPKYKYNISDIHFNWKEGFYCSHIDRSEFRYTWPLCFNVCPIYHSIYVSGLGDLSFINYCRGLRDLWLYSDEKINTLKAEAIESLKSINIRYSTQNCDVFGKHCQLLNSIVCEFNIYDPHSNNILVNNPNLKEINLCLTGEAFNIIPVSCKHLEKLIMRVNENVDISAVLNLINSLPTLKRYQVFSEHFDFCWSKYNPPIITAQWRLKECINKETLNKFIMLAAPETTSLSLIYDAKIGMKVFKVAIQNCVSLQELLLHNFSNKQLLAITKIAPKSLTHLFVKSNADVETIVAIITSVKTLQVCEFEGFTDTSAQDPSLVHLLRNTLLESQLTYFSMNKQRKSLEFEDRIFSGFNMNHYLDMDSEDDNNN